MNSGKTIFAQVMDVVPTYEFRKCVDRYKGDQLFLLGSISLHGIRPAHLPGELAGYSSLPEGKPVQTISSGHPWQSLPQCPGSCQSKQRLADLWRFRKSHHRKSQKTLGLRFNHNRPLFGSFPMGRVSETQGRGKATYSSGSAWQHSFCGHHNHREGSRCQYPGPKVHHGVELAYVFGNMNKSDGYDDTDLRLSKSMTGV